MWNVVCMCAWVCRCLCLRACVWLHRHTFCWAIQPTASWKLLPPSSQLPLVLRLLRSDPLMALWTPFSWSLHISILSIKAQQKGSESLVTFLGSWSCAVCKIWLKFRFLNRYIFDLNLNIYIYFLTSWQRCRSAAPVVSGPWRSSSAALWFL